MRVCCAVLCRAVPYRALPWTPPHPGCRTHHRFKLEARTTTTSTATPSKTDVALQKLKAELDGLDATMGTATETDRAQDAALVLTEKVSELPPPKADRR